MTKRKKAKKELENLKHRPAIYWEKKGEKMALSLFNYTRKNVPAYREYLQKQGFNKRRVRFIEDFSRIPTTTKNSYLRTYEYLDLFPRRNIISSTTISATSGSSGEPFFFPRGEEHDQKYEKIAEMFLLNQFDIDNKKTLGIIGFAFGIWIGGIFTYKNFNSIAKKGYRLTLVPVGTNKDLFLKSFKKFSSFYDQVILMGYPPFIKDVIDAGVEDKIDWSKYNLKILTAAEGYSEKFRRYIVRKLGIKNFLRDVVNIYGTVEQGTIANETSLGNLIRKIADQDKKIMKALFPGATNIPTVAQYDPSFVYIEADGREIVTSSYGSSIPLVRYKFSDLGGVIGFDEMTKKLSDLGVNIEKEAEKAGISDQILRLPFVYIYARSDSMVVFRGANIYSDELKEVLDDEKFDTILTGRFTLSKIEDKNFNQRLVINVELKKREVPKNSKEIKDVICEDVVNQLRAKNLEYNNEYVSNPNNARPEVVLCVRDDKRYFARTGKQKWVER